ncbi:hypothetical protein [Prauserella marina]|uniref:hypothetical protein n=1 Tax=Prauserella marina TaxID=530584 RepID=UPI0014730CF1|nr:hypothetical protein [Prauserella marina]
MRARGLRGALAVGLLLVIAGARTVAAGQEDRCQEATGAGLAEAKTPVERTEQG